MDLLHSTNPFAEPQSVVYTTQAGLSAPGGAVHEVHSLNAFAYFGPGAPTETNPRCYQCQLATNPLSNQLDEIVGISYRAVDETVWTGN